MVGKNSERNLHLWAKRQTWHDFLPDPFDFEILVDDPGGWTREVGAWTQTAEPIQAMHSCFLPHEVLHSLHEHASDVYEHLLGDKKALQDFWQAAASADDEWYRLHPVIAGTPAELCIPIGLHGAMQVYMVASRC